jgi:hypothetical protein
MRIAAARAVGRNLAQNGIGAGSAIKRHKCRDGIEMIDGQTSAGKGALKKLAKTRGELEAAIRLEVEEASSMGTP